VEWSGVDGEEPSRVEWSGVNIVERRGAEWNGAAAERSEVKWSGVSYVCLMSSILHSLSLIRKCTFLLHGVSAYREKYNFVEKGS